MILCTINYKVYIGETINFKRRYTEHIKALNKGTSNKYLQRDWDRFGSDNFTFVILAKGCDEEDLLNKETYWINYYGGKDSEHVYNCRDKNGLNKEFTHKARNAFKR